MTLFRLEKVVRRMVNRNMSSSSDIKLVGVVGLGLMGHGIAQITAQAGYKVLAIEAQDAALKAGMGRIEGSLMKMLEKEVTKNKIGAAEVKPKYDEIMSRISTTTSLADAKDCDLIIEAIVEKMDVKVNKTVDPSNNFSILTLLHLLITTSTIPLNQQVNFYKTLGPLIKSDAIFASNTSSLVN